MLYHLKLIVSNKTYFDGEQLYTLLKQSIIPLTSHPYKITKITIYT